MELTDMNKYTPMALRDPKVQMRISYVITALAVVGTVTVVKSVKRVIHR